MKTGFIPPLVLLLLVQPFALGQEKAGGSPPAATPATPTVQEISPAAKKDPRYEALEKSLTNVAFIGMFTVDRKAMNELSEERYEIKSIKKLAEDDDLWALEARIKYGGHDVTVPIVIAIKWAENTPVMTMDQILIPGLGTFSARVVIHDQKYAGTWTHDARHGHLFGRIEPNAAVPAR